MNKNLSKVLYSGLHWAFSRDLTGTMMLIFVPLPFLRVVFIHGVRSTVLTAKKKPMFLLQ